MVSGDARSKTPISSHLQRYIEFAAAIIEKFNGSIPFHIHLKRYFSLHKKHGSKDRKMISSLCYNYFRVAFGVDYKLSFREKILTGIFLCESLSSGFLEHFRPAWNRAISMPLPAKLEMLGDVIDIGSIFPFEADLSPQVDPGKFAISFLKQPNLFVRVRPGNEPMVLEKLSSANIAFKKVDDKCLAISNNEKVTDILVIDNEAVIQDYNSQRVADFFPGNLNSESREAYVWDCCAGSGGKSLLAFDTMKNIHLTVTDNRPSIIKNLTQRFRLAGLTNFTAHVLDGSSCQLPGEPKNFDLVIADAPCTGSGTWCRTPEQLHFFDRVAIEEYSALQKKILGNVVSTIRPGGQLLFITCSVFKRENEDNVDYVIEKYSLKLEKMEYLKGYKMNADTLFVATFTVP